MAHTARFEPLAYERPALAGVALAHRLAAHEKPYLLIPVGYPAEGAQVPVIETKPLGQVMVRIGEADPKTP